MLYKEKPPVIGACYYPIGETNVREFISEASSILGDVSEVLVTCDPHFGEVRAVTFRFNETGADQIVVKPRSVLCKEKKPGGEVWQMDIEKFKKKYEAV